jgi:hypothetical protein
MIYMCEMTKEQALFVIVVGITVPLLIVIIDIIIDKLRKRR